VRPAAHLAHEALLLHLAAELAQRLLELLRIFYDDLQRVITPLSKSLSRPAQPSLAGQEGALSIPEAGAV
jgi:hypothetical protein